jgi:hypothetical protein
VITSTPASFGLYAIAVIANDVLFEKRVPAEQAVKGLASIDWTWSNAKFRDSIGRHVDGQWKLNTGMATLDWLIGHCRDVCGVMLRKAA